MAGCFLGGRRHRDGPAITAARAAKPMEVWAPMDFSGFDLVSVLV